jgi:protein STU2
LTDVLEETQEGLKHKNPQVKTETLRFLVRCLRTTPFAPLKGEVTIIGESCTKLLGDTFEPVRHAAAEALGTLMKIVGERAMIQFLDNVDDIRKAKIKESFEKAEIKARQRPQAKPAAPAAGKGKPAPGGAGAGPMTARPAAGTRAGGPARPTSLKRPTSVASSIDKELDSPKKPTIARPGVKPHATTTNTAAAPPSRLAPRQSMAPAPARVGSPTSLAPKKSVVEEPPAPAPKLGRGLMGRVISTY